MAVKIGTQFISPDGHGVAGFGKDALATLKAAVTGAVGIATRGMVQELRHEIGQAGLGGKLPNAVRGEVYPQGGKTSLRAAGFIYPRGKGAADILESFSQGVTIRGKDGLWLAIPTKEAGTQALGKRITPGLWEQATGLRLKFVYRPGRVSFLVATQQYNRGSASRFKAGRKSRNLSSVGGSRGVSAIIFILVRQVTLAKRLDPDAIAQRWADRAPDLIDRAIPAGLT
jgi:hypothetical protein